MDISDNSKYSPTANAKQGLAGPESGTSPSAQRPNSSGVELPKGGGAIRGISENFSANPVTGTASLSIPIPVAPARGFQPELALSYDSGSGNSAFGLGWNLGLAAIARKTDKGLPRYRDYDDSDTYTLAGAEDLVALLSKSGEQWSETINIITLLEQSWEVKLYRPRIEGSFIKIERWREPASNTIWWRTVSTNNITTVYGFHDQACVFEPGNRAKTFRWMIDFSYDDKGHFTQYCYKREDQQGVPFAQSHEQHREGTQFAQLYLKKVLYGIKESRIKSGYSDEDLFSQNFSQREQDFHFQTVLDYGDHSVESLSSIPDIEEWPTRQDAFSNYKAGFEVRTYRRCQRIMLFYDFPELGNEPELISALNLEFDLAEENFSFLASLQTVGYKRGADGQMEQGMMPKVEFEYQTHHWNKELKSIDSTSLENIPAGLDGSSYQWLDLYSEGLTGVITEQAGGLYYKQNLGSAVFAEAKIVSPSPSLKGLANGSNFQDVESNGIKSLVSTNGVTKGYYEFDGEQGWQNFIPFDAMPNVRLDDANARLIDLNGDGRADVLITEERVLRWYPSLGKGGYQQAEYALQPEGDGGVEIIFANTSESIFTADMTGDGLSDIVRIRNASVEYWPNKGYGNFGKKVVMSGAPHFNHPDIFTNGHIRLADLDGSGTTDIIYLGANEFRYWLNNSGNSWSNAFETINPFPNIDNLSAVSVMDLLGTGTACVVWTTSLPGEQSNSIRYIDLMSSKKPHLMKQYKNGFGKTVSLEYTPSTQFYLEDRENGEPWITKLHFPVHCLSKTESVDHITGARFASSYSYHHGYFDHAEREFRGFGRVDQIDTEEYAHFVEGASSNVQEKVLHQTPVLVKTWFHNGAYLDQERINTQYQSEYYPHDNLETFSLPEPELPDDLVASEWREALRACKGMALRTETYGLDSTAKQDIPFSVAYNICAIRRIQPKQENKHAVFQVLNTESISLTLDRNPDDPRVSHSLLLETNPYGQPSLSAVVSYGRKPNGLTSPISSEQERTHCVISQVDYTNDLALFGEHEFSQFDDVFRAQAPWKNSSFEYGVEGWQWSNGPISKATLLTEVKSKQSVEYLRVLPDGTELMQAEAGELRLLSCAQNRFANETLDAHLPFGELSRHGIGWDSFQQAFTRSLIDEIYAGKVSNDSLEGGYLDINQDGNWWAPSGTAIYHHPDQAEPHSERFFLPFGSKDSFGAASWSDLDSYLMLPVCAAVSRVGFDAPNSDAPYLRLNEEIVINDYRTLAPKYTRDVNHNWSGVEVDLLGMVIKSAVMGKVDNTDRVTPPADNAVTEGDNLENPSAEMTYGFFNEVDGEPAWVKSKTYTKHYAENQVSRGDLRSRLEFIEQYEYSDGGGNIVMVKAQTTPGIAKELQADGSILDVDTRERGDTSRWIGNGRTIINNKGNPIKQYEPYFSTTHEYESAAELVETGITPILFYDAAGRNVCKLNPNKTYEKVVFDAWQQQSWDVNDTLYLPQGDGSKITDFSLDSDIGHFFAELERDEYFPSWYAKRVGGSIGVEEQRAAQLTESHVATPSEAHLDSLGRTIYLLAYNRVKNEVDATIYLDEKYATKTHLDIEGNMLNVVDDRGNRVMSYRYNMLPPPDQETPKSALYQKSMDGGEKWTIADSQGKGLKSWDSRQHVFESRYDELHRPLESWLTKDDVVKLIGFSEYVDSDLDASNEYRNTNRLASLIRSYDQAGRSQTHSADFKGNLLESSNTLATNYKTTIDWNAGRETLLEAETFTSSAEYDALNRIVRATSPHHEGITPSLTEPTYNESGALDVMGVSIRGGDTNTYVEDIEYDAKGQRQFIRYGNGIETRYEYDPETYRLKRCLSAKGNTIRQDLNYYYDPVGNISEIRDFAQAPVYFSNAEVRADTTYQYDALYQLIEATGREHSTQANIPSPDNGWSRVDCSNHQALQKYVQTFRYDSAGNIELMKHRRPNASNTGWTRNYAYAGDSNRLLATTLDSVDMPFDETYSYNTHGSITSMNHLNAMEWDFAEQLKRVEYGDQQEAHYVCGSDGQRSRKVIERAGEKVKERLYIGGWEIYREYSATGLTLERESLHVMDDQQRIALVETKTFDGNSLAELDPVIRYQLASHLGSARIELDSVGDVISYEEFHPYGTTAYHCGVEDASISEKRYRYTSKEKDQETGFSGHGARYLVPWLCRWLNSDPMGLAGGLNLFAYVRNNPVVRIDTSGTIEKDVVDKLVNNAPVGTTPYTEVRAYSIDPKTGNAVQVNLDVIYVDNRTRNVTGAIEAKDLPTSKFRVNQGVAYPGLIEKKRALVLDPAGAHTADLSGKVVEPDVFKVLDHGNVDDFVAGRPTENPTPADIAARTESGTPKVHAKGSLKKGLYDAADNWAKGVPSGTRTTMRRRSGVTTRIDQALDAAGNPMGKPTLTKIDRAKRLGKAIPGGRIVNGAVVGITLLTASSAAHAGNLGQSADDLAGLQPHVGMYQTFRDRADIAFGFKELIHYGFWGEKGLQEVDRSRIAHKAEQEVWGSLGWSDWLFYQTHQSPGFAAFRERYKDEIQAAKTRHGL